MGVECTTDLLGRFHPRYHSLAVVLLHKSGTSNTSQVRPFDAIIYITTDMYSLFWTSLSLTTIATSFMAFGILHMRGVQGWAGWRYLSSIPLVPIYQVSDSIDGYSSSKASSPSPSDWYRTSGCQHRPSKRRNGSGQRAGSRIVRCGLSSTVCCGMIRQRVCTPVIFN